MEGSARNVCCCEGGEGREGREGREGGEGPCLFLLARLTSSIRMRETETGDWRLTEKI